VPPLVPPLVLVPEVPLVEDGSISLLQPTAIKQASNSNAMELFMWCGMN